MPRYRVKAFLQSEGIVEREVDAPSPQAASLLIQNAGLHCISVSGSHLLGDFKLSNRKTFDHKRFAQEVHTLLDAGLSITETLKALASHDENGETVLGVLEALRGGKGFSQALQDVLPDVPELLVGLIRASEQTGNLQDALGRYVAYREKIDSVRKRLVTALIYPALLLVVGGLVIVFLLGFVVPRFAAAYDGVVRNLPLMSRLIIEWGGLVRESGGQIGAVTLILASVASFRIRHALQHNGLAALVSWSPALRRRLRDYDLSRFYRTVGLQIQGGLPVLNSLEMASGLLKGDDRPALEKAITDLREGKAVTGALAERGLAPPVVADLLRVGERSGELGERMVRIADFLDESVTRWMEAFTRLFEPLLMLGLGVLIAGIVVLLYIPIFELAENIR